MIRTGKQRLFSALAALFLLAAVSGKAGPGHRKVLFLGNSYTYSGNIPLMVAGLASAAGDTLSWDGWFPGGYTLGWQPIAHVSDPISLGLIAQGGWDFVVLQEQSQIPVISRLRDSCMYPASISLKNAITATGPCSRILFYLTWGRRFGGMQCFTPAYCSPAFNGFGDMQDSLTLAYKTIADSLSSPIAPVGEAWRYVIGQYGMVLHEPDLSHPNLNGSYLAACVFYASIFGKPTAGNLFLPGLSPDTALLLQKAADSVTLGHAGVWNLAADSPSAAFTAQPSADTVYTSNLSTGATQWFWDFGDGYTSAAFEPVHIYSSPGTYEIELTACNDCFCDTARTTVEIVVTNRDERIPYPREVRLTGPGAGGKIRLEGYSGDGHLLWYDMTGRVVGKSFIDRGSGTMPGLAPGLYYWLLTDPGLTTRGSGKTMIR